MSIKYDRVSVSPGVNVASRINQELQKIQEALERALDRLGDSPNAMESDLDMGLNSIINLKSLDVQELLINGEKPNFGGGGGEGIEDAPEDGKLYGRKDGDWEEGVEEAPKDDKLYGRKDGEWVEYQEGDSVTYSADMIEYEGTLEAEYGNTVASVLEGLASAIANLEGQVHDLLNPPGSVTIIAGIEDESYNPAIYTGYDSNKSPVMGSLVANTVDWFGSVTLVRTAKNRTTEEHTLSIGLADLDQVTQYSHDFYVSIPELNVPPTKQFSKTGRGNSVNLTFKVGDIMFEDGEEYEVFIEKEEVA